MTPLEELMEYGLRKRFYNPLRRARVDYIEDLLGTDPWYNTVAYGPEPVPPEPIPEPIGKPGPKHSKIQFVQVTSTPGSDTWYYYRWRLAWADLPLIGVTGVENIKFALYNWQLSNWEKQLRTSKGLLYN